MPVRPAPTPAERDLGGVLAGVVVAVLILAVVAVGAFYYFGGDANVDVKIKKPQVTVTSDATPGN